MLKAKRGSRCRRLEPLDGKVETLYSPFHSLELRFRPPVQHLVSIASTTHKPKAPSSVLASKWLWRTVSVVALIAAWEVFGRMDERLLFPPLSRVLKALWTIVSSGELFEAFMVSLQAFAIAFVLSVIAGLWTAMLMARYPVVERIANPYLDMMLAAPTVAFVPLFVIWFGLGLPSRVGVVVSFAFPLITASAFEGFRGVDRQLVEMAQSYGLTGRRMFAKIALPASLPLLIAGLRLGASRAFVGMVIADVILVAVGLGALIQYYSVMFKTAELFATILSVIVVAVLLAAVLNMLEKRVTRRYQP